MSPYSSRANTASRDWENKFHKDRYLRNTKKDIVLSAHTDTLIWQQVHKREEAAGKAKLPGKPLPHAGAASCSTYHSEQIRICNGQQSEVRSPSLQIAPKQRTNETKKA